MLKGTIRAFEAVYLDAETSRQFATITAVFIDADDRPMADIVCGNSLQTLPIREVRQRCTRVPARQFKCTAPF
jgi:hypothetical protein